MLKDAADEIAPYLHVIIQKSLSSGELPSDWLTRLTASISPIYKKGSRSIAANYRPVSLTYVSGRLLEHIFPSYNGTPDRKQHLVQIPAWIQIVTFM